MSIVLAEDKQYYQDASVVYAGVETIYQEEDTQPITVPIIAKRRVLDFDMVEEVPDLTFSYDYLKSAMSFPDFTRTVSVVGSLHAGKTTFVDMFVRKVRSTKSQIKRDSNFVSTKKTRNFLTRYTDTRQDERDRGISTKSTPISYMLPDSRGKSHLVHLMDTPGHSSFWDEIEVSTRISDGVYFVVDAVSGITESCKRLLSHIILKTHISSTSLVLVITQLDRLIMELRLPPTDAYFKLKQIVDEANVFIASLRPSVKGPRTFTPESGNVLFGSGKFGFYFSLSSFWTSTYEAGDQQSTVSSEHLWGDMYWHEEEGRFSKDPPRGMSTRRSFVQFVLEPIYKLFVNCFSAEMEDLKRILSDGNIYLPASVFEKNRDQILVHVMSVFLHNSVESLVDAAVNHVCSSSVGNKRIVDRYFGGLLDGATSAIEPPLLVYCVKQIHDVSCESFSVLARVVSGTLKEGSAVTILGESFSFLSGEEEDSVSVSIGQSDLRIPGGRYTIGVESVPCGNLVLISNVDNFVTKTATIIGRDCSEDMKEIFAPINFSLNKPFAKIALEPHHPSELPKMVQALRRIDRAYPSVSTKVEESGEHVIVAAGELALDSVLHDIRNLYSEIEIRLTDPVVVFSETCVDTSQFQCSSASPNKMCAVSFIAEPLSGLEVEVLVNDLSAHIDGKHVSREKFYLSKDFRVERNSILTEKLGWDVLASRNLWAFGPDWATGSNALLNDTLPDQVSKADLSQVRESVVQGFQWATREGPLLEENIRNCKFKLLDIVSASPGLANGSGQIIPATCRAVYGAMLTASPRLMEPVCVAQIDIPNGSMESVMKVLSKRRGHVVKDFPKPGTPLHTIIAHLPEIEAFGFETDIRLFTKGLGFALTWFDHWAVVPGDPLDRTIPLDPLQPAPPHALARDFLTKTRKRKGLGEDVAVEKYIDDVVALGLARA